MSGPLSDGDRTLSPAASDDSQPPPLTDLQRFARTLLDAGVRLPKKEES
jgi:hypothetical protein